MKNLNMTISILFIMFTANCIGMEALTPQKDSPKAKVNSKNASNFEFNNPIKIGSLNSIAPKEKIYTDDVAVPELKTLFEYIYSGNLDGFKNLLLKSPELKLMTDSKGNDALIVAAYYAHEDFIKFLLDKSKTPYNMNFYNINDEGESAFIIACNKKNWKAVKYILDILPNNLPNTRLARSSLKEGLEIINSFNDNSSECENITKLINEKLSLH